MKFSISCFFTLTTRIDESPIVCNFEPLLCTPSLMKIINVNGLMKVVLDHPGSSYIRRLPWEVTR